MDKNYHTFDPQASGMADQILLRNNEPPTQVHQEDTQSGSEPASLEVISLSDTIGDDLGGGRNSGNSSSAANKGAEKMAGQQIRRSVSGNDAANVQAVRRQPLIALASDLFKIGTGIAVICLNVLILKNNADWQRGVADCSEWDVGCSNQDKIWLQGNGFMNSIVSAGPVITATCGGFLIADGVLGLCSKAAKAVRINVPG